MRNKLKVSTIDPDDSVEPKKEEKPPPDVSFFALVKKKIQIFKNFVKISIFVIFLIFSLNLQHVWIFSAC